jgi:hypothetical protein
MYDVSGSLVINVCVGLLLLLVGRKLFWFYIGVLGFLVGLQLGQTFFAGSEKWTYLAGSVVFGIIGALLASLFQWAAVLLAGCLGGGYFFMEAFGIQTLASDKDLLIVAAGGLLGMLVLALTYDWALIIMSSLTGSLILAHALTSDHQQQVIVVVAGTLLGMIVQAKMLKKTPDKKA